MEDLCRDMVMYHLMKTGLNATEALSEYHSNPALRAEVEGLASIHVRKMTSPKPVGLAGMEGATPLGNGLYRITSPNRSAVTGRFNKNIPE